MELYDAIKIRRSVRQYRDNPVPDDALKNILEAARMAPSTENSQDYKFVVVKDAATKKALAGAAEQRFIAEAPVIIAGVSLKPGYLMDNEIPAYAVDLAIAFDHITLAAVQEDLGTCWIGAFNQDKAKRILKIPDKYKIVALMPLGTPYDEPGVKARKKINELVCNEFFSEKNE